MIYKKDMKSIFVYLLIFKVSNSTCFYGWPSPTKQIVRHDRHDLFFFSKCNVEHDENDDKNDSARRTMLNMENLSLEQFKRRRQNFEKVSNLQEQMLLPPNPFLNPREFIVELLRELSHPRNNRSHSGVLCLLDSSTSSWRTVLCRSVGLGTEDIVNQDEILARLELFLKRKNNQFEILMGDYQDSFLIEFPTDPLDYGDGKCWVECRLRDSKTDDLLVVTGWSLEKRDIDGAWLLAELDWQDFREEFRPGLGREEWERICG